MKIGQARIGVCPIGKFVFSHQDAIKQKVRIFDSLAEWGVEFSNIDEILPDGLVRDQKHVDAVVDHFKKVGIDCLFMPHCNFGTEGAAAMIAKKLAVPVLLWGPRDEAPQPDGTRLRDSLCGMLATSKVLHKLGVPFMYAENGTVDDPGFKKAVTDFLRVAATVRAARNMRIAQIGVRIDFFWTTIGNENELLQKFGVEILPFDMADFLRKIGQRAEKDRDRYLAEIKTFEPSFAEPELLRLPGTIKSLAMRDELFEIAEEHHIDAFSIKTFTSIQSDFGDFVPLGEFLVQERYPIAVESDIHGAISSLLLQAAATGKTDDPVFLPEFTVRHPTDDNAVLLWHASIPLSIRHVDRQRPQSQQPIQCHPAWILKGLPGFTPNLRIKDGDLTVCRFDGENGRYVLGAGEGRAVEGPPTRECYAWMKVDHWPTWERQLIQGPYIHHCSAIHTRCADILQAAVRFIPGLEFERFGLR